MNARGALAQKSLQTRNDDWQPGLDDVIVGKDILELISSSMYVDPITIYREYVQNAADAIDDARRQALLTPSDEGSVDIDLDPAARTVRIRDNGTGIAWPTFKSQLTAFGASAKRGTAARGFRGVGRLSGLGYCQELVFRSRASGETQVSEIRWDCRKLKAALRSSEFRGGLADLVREIVAVRRVSAEGFPRRFFEVELKGVVRHRNDRLLNPTAISDYLAQIAPVPFSPSFRFASQINRALEERVGMGNIGIRISGLNSPVYRPHADLLEIDEGEFDAYTEVEIQDIPGVDGEIAAVAWVAHHGYAGAIPAKTLVKGLRVRCGNVQVGDHGLLEELFPEARFNAWSVGEVHVIDKRIVPNGRRDHFEQSVHFDNLLNQLSPTARDIARRCRVSSIRRKWLRDFEVHATVAREKMAIIGQGSLGKSARALLAREVERAIAGMEKIAGMDAFSSDRKTQLLPVIEKLTKRLKKLITTDAATPLEKLPKQKRAMYEHLFGLIYECSANRIAAKALVDRILVKLR